MRSFFLALQFLTIFPYPKGLTTQDGDLARSMGHYSTIGALLGAGLYLGDRLLWGRIPLDMINLLLLAALAILTGCLHWDGFADTIDALGGTRTREERLAIMKDSRLGAFGALGLIFLILWDLAALHHLTSHRGTYLFLAPLLSRFSMVTLALTQPYARREGGLGRSFVEQVSLKELGLAGGVAVVACTALLGIPGIFLFCLVSGFALLLGAFFRSRFGGITGDTLGASNEMMMALVWFFGCIQGR